jgi:hypothetical protein
MANTVLPMPNRKSEIGEGQWLSFSLGDRAIWRTPIRELRTAFSLGQTTQRHLLMNGFWEGMLECD